jgi:uncharacterized protein (DUF433 family)
MLTTVVRTSRGLSIVGTRITLYSIMDYLKAGKSPELIRDHFRLTIRQTADVLDYIEKHRTEVEAEYQQVLKEAEEERRYWEEQNRERFAQIAAKPPKPGQEKIRAKLQATKEKLGIQ